MYVYYCRTYDKAVSDAGEGEVVSKEVGEEERGAQG